MKIKFKKTQKNLKYTLITVFAMCLLLTSCGKDTLKDTNTICEGVTIASADVGGMTKEQAKKAVEKLGIDFAETVLNFEYEDVSFSVNGQQIDLVAEVDTAVDEAYKIGRSDDKKKNKEDIKTAEKSGIDIALKFSFNKDKFQLEAGNYLGSKTIDPSPMNVEIGEDCLIVTNALPGKIADVEKAADDINKELADLKSDKAIELEIIEYTPDNLSFKEFKKLYLREAKDAVYTETDGTHNIEPEIVGIDFDEDEAEKILKDNEDNTQPYEIPAKITYPEITAKVLEDKYVNKIMAQYSSSFAGSSAGRVTNIQLAASKINGYVINPGERFSFNKVVGPRTVAAGFKNAHVYVGTQVVDGIGGGICQVSSTLYNAVVMADLKTVSRTNHSMPVGYVPLGRDATVSYGTIDYVFENNKSYPVSIKAGISGTTLTISVVGTSEMDYTVEFATKFIQSIAYGTNTIEDDTLTEGQTKTLENGSNGSVYESYRVYKRNGVEYDRKFESKSRYQPVPAKVAVGTAKPKKEEDTPKVEQPPVEELPPIDIPPVTEEPKAPMPEITTESEISDITETEGNVTNVPENLEM